MATTLKKEAKQLLFRIAPGTARTLQEVWGVRKHRQVRPDPAVTRLARTLTARAGVQVQSGPFTGMIYVKDAVGSVYLSKLVGSYEDELHPLFFTHLLKTDYTVIVDVGCAEGYYAVGMARAKPNAVVYAYDIDGYARWLCKKMGTLNGVSSRLHVRGECNPATLQSVLRERALVICDCEGYERTLLDPALAPALKQADILVELHDFLDPTISRTLQERFCATHAITILDTQPKDGANYPLLRELSAEDRRFVLDELRPQPMQWAFMTPLRR